MRPSDWFLVLVIFSVSSLVWMTMIFRKSVIDVESKGIQTWLGSLHDDGSKGEMMSFRGMGTGLGKEVHPRNGRKNKAGKVETRIREKPLCKPIDWGLGLYCCDGVFDCGEGVKVPCESVNDDFCDCPNGGDEWLTPACGEGYVFNCTSKYGPSMSMTFVRDGVCDCCDGSDELEGLCPVTCKPVG